jgi:transcriptional regulator with XRE-family HTH domain
MTDPSDPLQVENLSRQRVVDLLELLARQGLTQQQVASRANLPGQYVSDMKHGRRPVSELAARRIGAEFDVNYKWLLGTSNSMESPESRSGYSAASSDASPTGSWLPLLSFPIEGEPRAHPAWDSTMVEIAGAAADKLVFARLPYALRFGHDDVQGRLRKNDLVLISQTPSADAEISVVRFKKKLFLARRRAETWERVAKGNKKESILPRDECTEVGHCVGIIWGSLYIPRKA